MDIEQTIMRWVIFILGLGAFMYSLWKRHQSGSGPQLMMLLGIPSVLMIIALLSPVISSIEIGSTKVKLNNEKKAAALLLSKRPEVAEALTGERGTAAVIKAIETVNNFKKSDQLHQYIPYVSTGDSVLFFPGIDKENKGYVVETTGGATGNVKAFTIQNNDKQK